MGDFTQVSVGDGILKLDGTDAGFIRNVSFNRTLEQLTLETGNPRREQGKVPVRETVNLTAEFLELSMLNFSRFLGIGSTVVLAAPVVVAEGDQTRTFSASGQYPGALERIALSGPGVTGLVIKSSDLVTTYTEGTDYMLDGTSKGVIRLSGGSISSGELVSVAYSYTPVASTTIKGGGTFDFQRFSLEFTHPKIKAGTDLIISHSIVEPSSDFAMSFNADDFIANSVQFDFIYDETLVANGNPLFTFTEQPTV